MYGTYEKDSVMNYAKDIVKRYLEMDEGSNIYPSDFTANVSNFANADGCVFIYDNDAKSFINDNYEEAQKAYDYAKYDLGMDINPFEDPHKVVAVMIDMAVNELAQNCEILQGDRCICLDMSTCDRIMNDMGIEYDAGERFNHIGNDTIQFVHEWQEALEKKGADALEDCSPICTPILGEYGDIVGQEIRISETPAVWIDTCEEKICVYQAGELAVFNADVYACDELVYSAIEEFGEEIDTWTLEEKMEATHSTLDTAKEGLDHYFDEGEMVNVERELDKMVESCEEKQASENKEHAAVSKDKDEPEL